MTLAANAMEDQPAATEADPSDGKMFSQYRRTQFIVAVASVLCFALFWFGGAWLRIPAVRGFQASVIQQSYWLVDVLAIYVMLVVAVIIGTLISSRSWFFGGLFAGSIGLMALSARGGPMRYVLFAAANSGSPNGVFLRLIVEQCLLFVPIALMWIYFSRKYEAKVDAAATPQDKPQKSPAAASVPLALLAQFAVMAAVTMLLTPTDAKKQVLIGVFLAGLAGAMAAEAFFPARKAAAWFWLSPLVVGVFGYGMAYLNGADFTIGSASGNFANLARALPLDYASVGVAGTLLGYWIGAERPAA